MRYRAYAATGNTFSYIDAQGRPLADAAALERIRKLVIPPAWRDVWICPHENGHIQVTGRDAKGRKQYRYHSAWRRVSDENKFDRLPGFGRILPKIRQQVETDLRRHGLPREKVLAAVIRLLKTTRIRVGNREYMRENHSFGLTTLRNRHVKISGEHLQFDFRGKSGKKHHIELDDPRLGRIVRRCRDIPGQDLFQYVDESGEIHRIGSSDVNNYLRAITGADYSAKDFRTWAVPSN